MPDQTGNIQSQIPGAYALPISDTRLVIIPIPQVSALAHYQSPPYIGGPEASEMLKGLRQTAERLGIEVPTGSKYSLEQIGVLPDDRRIPTMEEIVRTYIDSVKHAPSVLPESQYRKENK